MPADPQMGPAETEVPQELFKPWDESAGASELKRIEYWSKTYRTWIPAEVTAIQHETQRLQINVKPGMWLPFSDFGKKLRVAVYERSPCKNDRPTIAQLDYDSINEANANECENIDALQFKPRSLNCAADEILSCDAQDAVKDHCSRADKRAAQINIDTLPGNLFDCSSVPPAPLGDVADSAGSQAPSRQVSVLTEEEGSRAEASNACEQAACVAADASATGSNPPMHPIIAALSKAAAGVLGSEGRFAGYRCPHCSAGGLETIQDALDHCGTSPVGSVTQRASTVSQMVAHADEEERFSMEPEAVAAARLEAFNVAQSTPVQHHLQDPAQDGDEASILLRPSPNAREITSASSEDEHLAPEGYIHDHQPLRESSASAPAVSSPRDHAEMANEQATLIARVGDDAAVEELPKGDGEQQTSDPLDASYQKPKTRILGYCCPKCGTGQLASLQEAVQHCRRPGDNRIDLEGAAAAGDASLPSAGVPVTAALDSAAVPGDAALPSAGIPVTAAPCEPLPEVHAPQRLPALPGEPVAFNSHGQPIIARQVDPEGSRTVVLNDDGTCDVFGKQTIASLMSSTQNESDDWMQVLSDCQLRGLVHEMGQRLVESSQFYQARLSQWEGLTEKANLAFFGLSADATDRELDVAYRQLSKKMHPDKNGGTEDSKATFQAMKDRYETLKKKRQEGDKQESKEQEAEAEDEEKEEQSKDKDDKTIEFDPSNRDSLHGTAKKMLSQLSTLESSMSTLVQQLRRHGL